MNIAKAKLLAKAHTALAVADLAYVNASNHLDNLPVDTDGETESAMRRYAVQRAHDAQSHRQLAANFLKAAQELDVSVVAARGAETLRQSANAPPSGDTSMEGETCPNCGNYKKPGYRTCYECASADYDDCPRQCGRKKKKQFATCYECRGTRDSAQQAQPANVGYPTRGYAQTVVDDDEKPF